jgi:predicted DCC family thiol-disulfide oxidoreductase YuxK
MEASAASDRPRMAPIATAELVALFDGDCALCTATLRFIEARDHSGRIECGDLRHPVIADRFPSFTAEAVRAQLHAVDRDGRLYVGIDAVRECGRRLPKYRTVAWILGVPGIRFVAQRVYVLIAKHRLRLNPWLPATGPVCDDDGCAVDWDALEKSSP